MQSLPIDSLRSDFHSLIPNQHLVVEAETGSGKSTCLPVWAAEHGRVLVIEPRRIACTSLAEFIAESEQTKLGDKIGYAIKLDSKFSDKSQVVFVTPGVALRWFAENKLNEFDLVMVDEFHERRWDTDLLVALLKENNQHRMIVTSATMEGEKLAAYIGAKRLVSEGRMFKVDIRYLAREYNTLPDSRNLEQNVCDQILQRIDETDGDLLVFLPGKKEINQCAQRLNKLSGVEVVRLHASVSDSERHRALNRLDKQKVVLATNVAETSLTIPNITLVIDSGLERRTSQRNGRTVLSLKSISKASARQRSGRAGRVRDGLCVRLYGEHAALELMTPPELLREELTEAMLAAACCGSRLTELHFLDALPEKSLASAETMLKNMQAIDERGDITRHGQVLYPLPIDAIYADLLTRMPIKPLREAMLDLAAALSVPATIFKIPSNEEQLEELAKWEPNACDGAVLIRLVRGEKAPFLEIDQDALKEARGLAQQMRDALELPALDVASRYNRSEWLKAIIAIHPELVYVRREKRREAMGNGKAELMPGRNSLFADKDEAAIVLDQHSIPGRGVKQTLNLGSVMLPVPVSELIEMEIGQWCQGETVVEEGVLYSRLNLIYAGRTLSSKKVMPEGELLLKPIVDAVQSGSIFPGFAEKRAREIQLWKLYVELGLDESCTDHANISFESWFTHQLQELGITEISELDIFTEDDFIFEGIPYWQFDDFAEKYPNFLNIGDLQLDVEYIKSKNLIYVIYCSGLRKSDPKRRELPVWKGWKVQYKKASRIVDVR
ncbi:DEAD/DEAH box helicase [Vibrio sp. JC009]|uniref:helicase-related protein n=1 Tax=Vibrio sp. JC009 TaxID=2912314 RepID=UPI0023AED7FF|nr:helicase-related protein [Vibrio sp. JC009]WED23286.1 DEAD/DEAH box helicase [Vibrio sp. JC009]